MELHASRIVLLVVVAVDALAVALETAEHVVVDDALVIVFQTTLTDGKRLVADERGRNKTETQVGVNAVRRHMDGERLIVRPLISVACKDVNADVTALGC